MTKTDTITPVPRPRGVLSEMTKEDLHYLREVARDSDERYRKRVVDALGEGSFSAVAEATGLSKDTLQRWKREAGK